MIENNMVLPSAEPNDPHSHLEPEEEAICAACKVHACLVSDGWYADYYVDFDGESDYLSGDGQWFKDAADTPMGWVCSNACRSQAMYDQASENEKHTLDRVFDACRVLAEYGDLAKNILDEKIGDSPVYLTDVGNEFWNLTADAPWINRISYEDSLRCSILKAIRQTEYLSADLGSHVKVWENVWDWQSRLLAEHAATCARIAQELKSALEGNDD